jgi:hypothetical protein
MKKKILRIMMMKRPQSRANKKNNRNPTIMIKLKNFAQRPGSKIS